MPDLEQIRFGDTTARTYLRDPDGARAGVVVLHAWWGLNDDVIHYADRLADAGFAVIAPDMFDGQVASEPDDAKRLASEHDGDTSAEIAFGAVDRLVERLPPDAPLAALGWSYGAAYAIWAPSERDRLKATVVYYGTYVDEFLKGSTAPLLGHFASDDPFEGKDDIRALEDAYREAGREITIYTYPETGHWFAEPSRDAYRPDAAELAFERMVAFLGHRLGGS
jgi:carboxymethylenebutenolidase